jgi:hypothetical protein
MAANTDGRMILRPSVFVIIRSPALRFPNFSFQLFGPTPVLPVLSLLLGPKSKK